MAALLWAAGAAADSPAPPPDVAQAAAQAAIQGLVAELGRGQPSAVRQLDPAIFIELTPVTAAEPAVRLPEHQQERTGAAPPGEP